MSLDAILDAIETSGQKKVNDIQAQAKIKADEILAAGQKEAERIREQERQNMLVSARRKRAHLLHESHSKQLKIRQEGREHIIEEILENTRQRMKKIRAKKAYVKVLRSLTQESFKALSSSLSHDEMPILEVDRRDRDYVVDILADLPRKIDLVDGAETWGGVTFTSQDARVRVNNTLESRLERAASFLYLSLSTRFKGDR